MKCIRAKNKYVLIGMKSYHMEKGSEFAESSKDGTVGQLLRDSDLPPEVKSANLGFFFF